MVAVTPLSFLKSVNKMKNSNKNPHGAQKGNQNRLGKKAPEVQKAVTVRGYDSEIERWKKQYDFELKHPDKDKRPKSLNAWRVKALNAACTEQ